MLFFVCPAQAEENLLISASLDQPEGYSYTMNHRSWVIGFKQGTPTGTVTEWVPEGQNINHWKELITVQIFPSAEQDNPQRFMERFKKSILDVCPNTDWKTLQGLPQEVAYEFQIKNCSGQADQLEIGRVIHGRMKPAPKIIVFLHYATKNLPVDEKNKKDYWSILKDASLPERFQDHA